ncbi:MAG TPA: hypothetical protein VFD70_13920 [Anaerolineae bacterium]|nr:hypothetical protein [Anaerolineae bacterium]
MEFLLGILVGILIALGAGAVGVWVLLRDSSTTPLPKPETPIGAPVVMVVLVESFLNDQLGETLAAEPIQVEEEIPHAERALFDLKLNDASLEVEPGQRARVIVQATVSKWGLKLNLRPITNLRFVLNQGRVQLYVENVQVSGLNVPRIVIDRFVNEIIAAGEAKLNESLAQVQNDMHVELCEIETTEDTMILKFAERRMDSDVPMTRNEISKEGTE